MKKYIVWHIEGGLGKNVAATALIEDVKNTYYDRELIMVVSWPEVFLNIPIIDRVYSIGQTPHFYQDYIHNKDTLLFRHEPYNQSGHIHRTKHLINNWADLLNLNYRKQLPKLLVNYAQRQLTDRWIREKPTLVLHTNGGPYDGQRYSYNWCRDLPPELSNAIVEKYSNDYHIFQVCKKNSYTLPNVERIDEKMGNFELFSILATAQKRILIDSCLQHAATALGMQSTVIWIGTKPEVFGYETNQNISAMKPNIDNQLIGSYLFDYQFENNIHECPYNHVNEMFDIQNLINKI